MAPAIVPEAARSVAHRDLPPVPPRPANLAEGEATASLVLFYQYVEPPWTDKEHRAALKKVIAIATENNVKGRGRCAKEGLNCTLTGPPEAVRGFCLGLRAWQPEIFQQTDFKITDHIAAKHAFRALTLRRTDELVAYGMANELAPALTSSSARHVEADEYHELMRDKDAVIIDVRNAYESAIGHFQPPTDGATLIDPKMRNSHEFPKWLNQPATQEKLNGKKVLMYCTGGIRCERASALLDTMARTSNGAFNPEDVVMVRGGIERYMKTFPTGGFWKGKNYLFDRRLEQLPEQKSADALEADVESWCAACKTPCGSYRGEFKCAGVLPPPIGACAVPVIVCRSCARSDAVDTSNLYCPLCEEGYVPAQAKPDIVGAKRKLVETLGSNPLQPQPTRTLPAAGTAAATDSATAQSRRERRDARAASAPPCSRLFVGSLPFATCASDVRAALEAAVARTRFASSGSGGSGSVVAIQWVSDPKAGLFYGSAFVEMDSIESARAVVLSAIATSGPRVLSAAACRISRKAAKRASKQKAAAAAAAADGALGSANGDAGVGEGLRVGGRKLRVAFSPAHASDVWPPPPGAERERPPVGMS